VSVTQGHWPVPSDGPSVATVVPVAVGVARRRPVLLASVFAGIALLAVLLGLFVPKKYTAATSILVENGNIIEPLMEGRAVSTSVANRAMMARDVAFSRRVMNDILKTGGWMAEHPNALEQDRLIEQIKSRTTISTPMPAANAKTPVMGNLIQVSYYDSDPKRAYLVTKRFGELIIEESLANKERESRAAFEFIDGQVEQYHAKLAQAEAKLEDYRIANPDAREGVTGDVTSRIAELRRLVDTARMDMIDSGSEVAALQSQLSGESEISAVNSRSSQIRARLAELNAQRQQLLLTYTDQYPDVVRINHQINDLEQEMRGARTSASSRMAGSPIAIEASATMNPLYTELRSRLAWPLASARPPPPRAWRPARPCSARRWRAARASPAPSAAWPN
jgi:polysaccharide chain length determinant protein (PEP-CTERM system associated)